jgi:hypothetical protein
MNSERHSLPKVGEATLSAASVMTAKAVTRHYLASDHLWAATQNAAQCRELEDALKGFGPATHPTHRAYAVSAVMLSVAFLEALVNEIFQDAAETTPGRAERLTQHCRDLMKEYWNTADRADLLTKSQMALLFACAGKMAPGRAPMQGAALLIELRNALVHFKPSRHDNEDPTMLEKRLSGRFAKSELLPDHDGSPWPIWALAAPGAAWSVGTARAFADEWVDRMGLIRVYETDLKAYEETGGVTGTGTQHSKKAL